MSGGGWKEPFYKIAAQDSRNLADHFNRIGVQFMEDEAKHNAKNPGRAIGKAAANAALWYLTGPASAAESGAANAGGAVADTAMTVGGQLSEEATKQAIEQAIAQQSSQYAEQGLLESAKQGFGSAKDSMTSGWNSLKGLLRPEAQSAGAPIGGENLTMESGLMDTGYTPSNQWQAIKNAQNPMEAAKNLWNVPKGANQSQQLAKMQQMQSAMGLLNPQQQPQQMPIAPPRQQGPQEPLQMPYQNSMGLLSMEDLRKKRLREMGLLGGYQ